jgi:hypothetical protein
LGIQDTAFSADLISGELLAYIPNFCLASGARMCVPEFSFSRPVVWVRRALFGMGRSATKLAGFRASYGKWGCTRKRNAHVFGAPVISNFFAALWDGVHNWNTELFRHGELRLAGLVLTTITGYAPGCGGG